MMYQVKLNLYTDRKERGWVAMCLRLVLTVLMAMDVVANGSIYNIDERQTTMIMNNSLVSGDGSPEQPYKVVSDGNNGDGN